jgi:hypothetical protein
MGFIDFDPASVPEPCLVEAAEYLLECVKAESKESKAGKPMLTLLFKIDGRPDAALINHNIMLPWIQDDEDAKLRNSRNLKNFILAAGVDTSSGGFDPEMLKGCKVMAILKLTEDAEYGARNEIKRFMNQG